MLFMLSLNFTDRGIRSIKDTSKRIKAARDLAKKLGAEMKQLYLTTGQYDLIVFVEAPSGDHIAKIRPCRRLAREYPFRDFTPLDGRGILENSF
jgi:uncharacterized protein with GYD domain